MTAIFVFDTAMIQIYIWMDYPKLISEKWNLTAKFNCLQAIYFYAPSALAVPMCGFTTLNKYLNLILIIQGGPELTERSIQSIFRTML